MNFQKIIKEVFKEVNSIEEKGALASYIPELANVNSKKFGVHITSLSGMNFGVGDFQEKFSIQSISKVLSLCLAYQILGGEIWSRLGVEPSGNPFNSLIQLEKDKGIPRNPFINAGAMVIADILLSNLDDPKKDLLHFIRNLSGNQDVHYSTKISSSEKSIGYRNVALCNFIKSFDNIENEPDEVLDFYFNLCSIELSCKDLSALFLFLANQGKTIHDNNQILTSSKTKRINALMQTCGFYDESGEFAFKVGLPGKSGVGGGIIAVHPGQYAIAVWSPQLNEKGNSYKGMKFLEGFTTLSQLSIF